MELFAKNWKHVFVTESGLIDPQPGYPCYKLGQVMFDNHLIALDYALSTSWEINKNTPCDLHRLLTRDVSYFEDRGMSGRFRDCEVWIGHELCPHFSALPGLMDQWAYVTNKLLDLNYEGKVVGTDVAEVSHHMFEVIHPFIDGNGRTGRLLYLKVLNQCNEDPRIIYYKDRDLYYNEIQYFREKYWISNKFDVDSILADLTSF